MVQFVIKQHRTGQYKIERTEHNELLWDETQNDWTGIVKMRQILTWNDGMVHKAVCGRKEQFNH